MVKLFDLIDAMWDDEKWSRITNQEKASHYFMINRLMSIAFIKETSALNLEKINYGLIVEFWREIMKSRYKRKPNFLFTKTKKGVNKKDSSSPIDKISKEVKNFYMSENMIDSRDFEMLCKLFPDEILGELKMYEQNM